MERAAAVERVEEIVDAVESETMPVPVREIWVYGDVALGLDPVERLDVYLTKDVLLRDDAPDRADDLEERFGVTGLGRTGRADWVEAREVEARSLLCAEGDVCAVDCLARRAFQHVVDR